MVGPTAQDDFDRAVRLAVYRHLVESGTAPTSAEVALQLGRPHRDVRASFERLAEGHILVLDPATREVWMAMPFSVVRTPFRVTAGAQAWWANCAWDAFGIPAMWSGAATIETRCAHGEEPMTISVDGTRLSGELGVTHFAVPAARWWDDIGYT